MKKSGAKISRAEWITVTKKGKNEATFHVYVETISNQTAEIVVRSPDEAANRRKCEVFGDELTGLNVRELECVLEKNPAQKFVPA